MCLSFSALEVGKGDAFLLVNNGWNCLFDAGQYSNIIGLLQGKGIDRLDLAICSHNDVDHAKGFIELLNSSIEIDEIWLPGIWAKISQFVMDPVLLDDNPDCLLRNSRLYKRTEFEHRESEDMVSIESFNKRLSYFAEWEYSEQSIKLHNDLKRYMNEIPERCLNCYLKHLSSAKYSCYKRNDLKEMEKSLDINLNRIAEIERLAYKKRCRIRWFEPISDCVNNQIKFDYGCFVALNSKEIHQFKKLNNTLDLMFALTLTKENEHSLVFEYWNDINPVIRFSADSDCIWHSDYTNLENIIVTAPHHGSEANAHVYKAINGDNIIWVRSDCKSQSRPCKEFKSMKTKYCLACKRKTHDFKEEICFEYSGNKWRYVSGVKCLC